MNNYEVWQVTYMMAMRKESFTTDSAEEAMKSFVRNNLASAFYYDFWKKTHNAYVTGDTLYLVFRSTAGREYKQSLIDSAYETYLKVKRGVVACDCGALKCKTTHAHWCSTKG